MASTTIVIRTNGEQTVIETNGSTVGSVHGGSINGSVKGWANGITNINTNGYTNGYASDHQFIAPSDINDDPDRVKFAYWVPNVSGGLVISKIPQRTK
jgi:alkanesulfonate monooxygenase